MTRVLLSFMVVLVLSGVAAGFVDAELVASGLDTVTSVYPRPAVIEEVVALGAAAVPHVIPRLGSGQKATRDAAALVLSEICAPEHVVPLLEEHFRLREAGLRSRAIRVIESVVHARGASHPAVLSPDGVDSVRAEILQRLLSDESARLYPEFGADRSLIVIAAGLPTDGSLTRSGTPVEVIPLDWPEAKESFRARDHEGREYLRFSAWLLELPPSQESFPALEAGMACVPSGVGFVSVYAGTIGTDSRFGFIDLWVRCGGEWRFASTYIETGSAH